MPINTDLNVNPYNDDFDEDKGYHRILFRPATAVQARELTQLQTILQTQVERFGNWAFKNGDIVSGCSITDIPVLPYVRLSDFQANGYAYDVPNLINTRAVSSSNLQARVIQGITGLTSEYPNTSVIYLQYINTGNNGEAQFSNTDQLTFYKIPLTGNISVDTIAVINVYPNSTPNTYTTGNAHGISVSEGVVFLNGNFVKVIDPAFGIVNTFGTYAGNTVVGFQADESIVTENQDETLLDNALGSPNENAPGAHRLKIAADLVALQPDVAANTSGFNPIITYSYGSIVTKSTVGVNVYSIVGDVIKNRTYEESGNYVVNPFAVDSVTSLPGNNFVSAVDANTVLARINPGIGYALGERVEIQKTTYVNMRRGIDTQVNKQAQISFNYGGYFVLDEVAGSFDFDSAQTVDLYDAYQNSVTTRTFSSVVPAGNKIGNAAVRCISYSSGTVGSNTAQYNLHVFNINLANGYNASNIKSVYYNGTRKGVGDVISNGLVGTDYKAPLYSFGITGIKTLKDGSNNINTEYVYRKKISGSMNSSGVITYTITGSSPGGTDILPYGIGRLSNYDAAKFNVVATANVDSAALTGNVTVYNTNNYVLGNGTTFTIQFAPADQIKVGSDIRTVNSVINATAMTVDAPFGSNTAGAAYYKTYRAGKVIPITTNVLTGPSGYINVESNSTFTMYTGQIPASTLAVDVVFDVLRINVIPAKKEIKKSRLVRINTANNPAGPWCLGFSDVHQIRKISASANGTYTLNGYDVTKSFTLDTGQKDTHYDLAYIYPKSGFDATSTPYLVVHLDYFEANTTGGLGFFTIDSYPIDDANTANTTAIQTMDIPLYVTESGSKIPLRDYIDFRVPSTKTANDTGYIDTSNSTQLAAGLLAATLNPANTLTFSIPGGGLNTPSYGGNFEADYTFYLPRKDLICITPSNVLKIKEGISSTSPQTPIYPDNAMVLAVINVPAYPSLSTDQADTLLQINQSAKNLIRNTTQYISTNLVTNRRYTMRDIGKLDQRITNLEYYVQLSLLEKNASNMTVTDENGLDRFKNGIFVDPFSDFTLSDISNPEYSIAIDSSKGVARPRIVREIVKIDFNPTLSTNVQKTGRVISLPYTEKAFLVQPYATKYRSAAKVAYAWNGKVVLIPNYDNHGDTVNTGSLNITVDNTKAWQEFAASPFGSIWGDWRTTTTSETTSVVTGSADTYNVDLGWVGNFGSQEQATQATIARFHEIYGTNVIIGNLNVRYNSDIRLKRAITFLKKLANGLGLYSFKYLWSDQTYVGVMAQEVLKIMPQAVSTDKYGFYVVDYGMLGMDMIKLEQWNKENS